jgi:UDP-glucose:(heptosyl)LPS alpha-1,3-glucosyltransferase
MKVAVLSRNFSKTAGGAESYAVQLAKSMQGECDISVVSQTFDAALTGFHHMAVPRLPFRSGWINLLWFNWYSRKLTRHGFDIVHSHENVTHGNVQTVHVKTVHASLSQRGMSRWRILLSPRLCAYMWIEKKRLCSGGHQNVFVSQLLQNETLQVLPNLSSATFIPPGVELPEAKPTTSERDAARRELGLASDKPVIGFVGNDFKKKGLDVLLRALALVPFDVQLLVVGDRSQAARYSGLVAALGRGKECRFMGVVNDMNAVYCAIECLAHPTTQDVFPMVLLEAMAHRVPVVTTGAPFNSMASLLRDGTDVLLISDPQDHGTVGKALERILKDAALRRGLIANGYQFAEKYSWLGIKNRYYKVYREALAKTH